MSLFHKPTLIDVETILNRCKNLSLKLQEHYKINANSQDEWKIRNRIFDESKILEIKCDHFTDSMQCQKKSFKYCVNETYGQIFKIHHSKDNFVPIDNPERITSETEIVTVTLFDRFNPFEHTRYQVIAIIPESVWKKKYSNYTLGQPFPLNGLVSVNFEHSPSYNLSYQPQGCFMNFNIKVFLK